MSQETPSVSASTLAGTDPAAVPASQVPNPELVADHATARVTERLTSLFRDKTSRSLDRSMEYFARNPMFYTDSTLGWYMPTWHALKAVWDEYMPTWPDTARSYPTRIIGDERSAIVLFTDTPELFGGEVRAITALDFSDGLITRWVDYWDGRHFGTDAMNQLRVPEAEFPRTFGEDVVGDQSSPVLRKAVDRLNSALNRGDTTGLFTADATFEDLALRTTIVGPLAIDAYIRRSYTTLPYGRGATIRHTLGSPQGGGYEWINNGIAVDQGITAIELDEYQRISRLTVTWDGSRLDDHTLATMLADTIER
ncbi:hypothetical protein ACGFWD_27145 [Streptomyces sp. NPDC048448]|uniref:hypothetical protein n=1 Tax=Streptomyces sp. NPDC048448 TaxID=3365554 RepID=UPI0037128DD5